MSDLFLLSEAQMRRIEPYFPLSHGIARVDDRRVISGIIFVIKNGLRWRDAPLDYGPHKTIYNRFIRLSRLGVFNKIGHLQEPDILHCDGYGVAEPAKRSVNSASFSHLPCWHWLSERLWRPL